MPMPGVMEMLLILAVVLVLFGAKKLPQLGGAIGESIKNFKKGIKDSQEELDSRKELEKGRKDQGTGPTDV